MRRFFIHCGLHKTGSTSLQNSLAGVAGELKQHGLLYPEAGRVDILNGQHNLAWRLARDRRYHEGFGDIAALRRELSGWTGDVVISSEDFESSLLHPERWAQLLRPVVELQFQPIVIVYRRNPERYLDSLYVEKLKAGLFDEYQLVAREILETGRLRYHEWEFCFDFRRIVAAMSSLAGVDLRVRDFEHLVGNSMAGDFADALGAGADVAEILVRSERRDNSRIPLDDALFRFLVGRDPMLAKSPDWLLGTVRKFLKSPETRAVAPRRLSQALVQRFGTPEHAAATRSSNAPVLNIANVFSFETHRIFRRLIDMVNGGVAPQDVDRQIAAQASEWWTYASQLD